MCHGHWMHDRLVAGEPLDDPEIESEAVDEAPEEEPEPLAPAADD